MHFRITHIFLLLILALAGCSSSPSPVLPPAELTDLRNEFSIHRVWSKYVGYGASENYLRLTPIVIGNVGYAVDYTGKVIAFELETGRTLWEVEMSIAVSSRLGTDGQRLFVGTSQGEVIALAAKDGTPLWRTQLSSEILSPPQGSKGIVVARGVDGYIRGLDATDGKILWSHVVRVPSLTLRGTSSPLITNDIVLVGHDNGTLQALTLRDGKVLWETTIAPPRGRTELERMVDIDADLIIIDDVIYTIAFQGRLAAIQIGTGKIIWAREIDSYAGMEIDAYRIYLTDSEGQVWSLDRYNGATLWKQDKLVRRQLSRPQLHKQYVIVGDYNGYIHWLKREDGKLVARRRVTTTIYDTDPDPFYEELFSDPYNILAQPIIAGDLLIAMDRQGVMQAFNPVYP